MNGRGVPQDFAEATRWYRLAADQGFVVAQLDLAIRYTIAPGVPQDIVQGHMWDNIAAFHLAGEKREMTAKIHDLLAIVMTRNQLAEAQRLAHEWDAAHPQQ